MKAQELIALLQKLPADTEVLVATSGENSGDPDTAVQRITASYVYEDQFVLLLDEELLEL